MMLFSPQHAMTFNNGKIAAVEVGVRGCHNKTGLKVLRIMSMTRRIDNVFVEQTINA